MGGTANSDLVYSLPQENMKPGDVSQYFQDEDAGPILMAAWLGLLVPARPVAAFVPSFRPGEGPGSHARLNLDD